LMLDNTASKDVNKFYITVPNTALQEVKLQQDGWFTYAYKYGRHEGENKPFVKFVPFDNKNISSATYERLRQALPTVYTSVVTAAQSSTPKHGQ